MTSSQHASTTRAMGNTFTKLRAVTKIRTGNTTHASTPRDLSTTFTRVVTTTRVQSPLFTKLTKKQAIQKPTASWLSINQSEVGSF